MDVYDHVDAQHPAHPMSVVLGQLNPIEPTEGGRSAVKAIKSGRFGDPGGSRTPNPQIRSLMLYPVELRGRG